MESDPSPLVTVTNQPSGTVGAREGEDAPVAGSKSTTSPTKQSSSTMDGEALESHEVIELQTFIERKAWIEEKIQFLNKLPPIEVFVGIEALHISSEDIPGLPTRAQLQQWLVEHEIIEKETEVFDTGELKKLRKLTKAATQRTLSPEDTDLIELTLTTIYELDKLLHLLRDRSELLDLLGVRLSWEECRVASWVTRRQIIEDLKVFLETRARWSPSVYERTSPVGDVGAGPSLRRKGSAASLVSITSEAGLLSPGFSRTARFTQAELLSRDSAQFAARVTSLRHGSIATAGKLLDKIIDHSRRPVPEVLLDEQDKLEEMGIAQVEHIGKFVMNVVMQWRKADETYVETVKDKAAAQRLLDDIEAANDQHPTARQSASFSSRADTLRKRIAIRGDPMARNSSFPQPQHPLFPEQDSFNQSLVQSLSSDMTSALATVKEAEAAANGYRTAYEGVKAFEERFHTGQMLSAKLSETIGHLEYGVPSENGDGMPPDLTSEASLNPTAHSTFLALLPTTFHELDHLKQQASKMQKSFPAALLRLTAPGIDLQFRSEGIRAFEDLKELGEKADRVRANLEGCVERLREARRLKEMINDQTRIVNNLAQEVKACMIRYRWHPISGHNEAPPTPESPTSIPLPLLSPDIDFEHQIDNVASSIAQTIAAPLATLSETLEEELRTSLQRSLDDLNGLVERGRRDVVTLASIKIQSAAMHTIKDEVDAWRLRIEDLRVRYECAMEDTTDLGSFESVQSHLTESHDTIRRQVSSFIDTLPLRTHFIDHRKASKQTRDVEAADDRHTLPFIPRSLDDAVRHDCNNFTLKLNGDLRGLDIKSSHLHLTGLAKEVDICITTSTNGLADASRRLSELKAAHQAVGTNQDLLVSLAQLILDIDDHSQVARQSISRTFSPTRDLLRKMSNAPGVNDSVARESLYLSRKRRQDDAELRFTSWDEQVQAFRTSVVSAQQAEASRLEDIRVAEDLRTKAEQERLVEETAQRRREDEERRRASEAQKAAEERQTAEQARLKAEAEEKARLGADRRLEEERHRLAEKERAKVEDAQRLKEQQEKETYDIERREMELKLKVAKEELAAERKAHADRVALALQTHLHAEAVAQTQAESLTTSREHVTEDVFGPKISTANTRQHKSQDIIDLQVRILDLRKRIRAMSLVSRSRPKSESIPLPTSDEVEGINGEFVDICEAVSQLPSTIDDESAQVELESLLHEVDISIDAMERLRALASLTKVLTSCDAALSDLLEHIDSYPSSPVGPLATSYRTDDKITSEEQMAGRLSFTKATIDGLAKSYCPVSDDPRATSEQQRVLQTWSELQDMAQERMSGRESLPITAFDSGPSTGGRTSRVTTSGRNSRASLSSMPPPKVPVNKKSGTYTNLSLSSRTRAGSLAVPSPYRRAVSHSSDSSSSRVSISSNRSSSNPMGLYGSTFASRQRTTSLTPSATPPPRRTSGTSSLFPRVNTPTLRRGAASPSISDVSSVSNITSTSSWSRAPRMSLPRSTPPRKAPVPRKAYVANPKSKLDVAVGDVVNNLPVGINIEGVSGSWKDQSGKYWIGDQDPRLCFCRILRSQTVMVRVGGGWQELSKFIRGHFADSFRLLSDSPKAGSGREERWISSTTLMEAAEIVNSSPPRGSRTPDPTGPYLPSFAISTPSGQSPRSLKSSPSSKGSPLTPLQFIRRAESETSPFIRPNTPSKTPSTSRMRGTTTYNTPSRNTIWRP